MDMSDIIGFRTAYLRLIAKAWNDAKLLASLPKLNSKQVQAELAKLGHAWLWGGLDIKLGINGPVWSPVETGGWYGHGTSTITLRLPLNTEKIEDYSQNQARALTDYYGQRPTLFGLPTGAAAQAKGGASLMQAYSASLGDFNSFLDFGGVTVRAVALAWHNAKFKKALVGKNSLGALERWLGFHSTWEMKIEVEEDKSARWTDGPGWQSLSNNLLTLVLPTKPKEDDIRAIAITAYNETGPQYPFTCCD
jgi:ribosomally synthesized peptide (two-chain TOMM family)